MTDNIINFKAIETVHSGYRFRSRLEVRWFDGQRYLPDFFLPSKDKWYPEELRESITPLEEAFTAARQARF